MNLHVVKLQPTRLQPIAGSQEYGSNIQWQGQQLCLPHPGTGQQACFLLQGQCLQEMNWFKQEYSSWFIDNFVLQDGGLVACTPCDLTFVLLPMLETARGKNAETSGRFCNIEQILHSDMYPDLARLTHLAGVCMETVCDHKEVDGEKYYRLNNGKVQAWLCCKVSRLQQALKESSSGVAFQGMDELQLAAYCVAVLAEYVQEHWLTELREVHSVASQGDEIAPSQLQSSQESNPQAGGKRPRFDPKELAKKRLKEVKDEAKRVSLAKEASTMRSITSFFAKPNK